MLYLYSIQIKSKFAHFPQYNSIISNILPKNIIIKLLENVVLNNAYKNGFFVDQNQGAQLFIIAKKG